MQLYNNNTLSDDKNSEMKLKLRFDKKKELRPVKRKKFNKVLIKISTFFRF